MNDLPVSKFYNKQAISMKFKMIIILHSRVHRLKHLKQKSINLKKYLLHKPPAYQLSPFFLSFFFEGSAFAFAIGF